MTRDVRTRSKDAATAHSHIDITVEFSGTASLMKLVGIELDHPAGAEVDLLARASISPYLKGDSKS